jgi:diamine N-acetyltransferase
MGRGCGTDALITLCQYLYDEFQCGRFYLAPSHRNTIAIHAYRKAGFLPTTQIPVWFVPDYEDTIVLVREWTKT